MCLMLGKNVVIIGSMYFMSSGFTKLKFKYLSQEFSENQVLLIKVEYEYMNSFEMFNETKLQNYILFLADVFSEFRNMCIEYYGLDLCHYFSGPILFQIMTY